MKNQLKKSLSLIMAVLMVLSCWVWVAPTKAEAADYKDGYYYVRITTFVSDTGAGDNNNLTITYKTNNGMGDPEKYTTSFSRDLPKGKNIIFEGYIPGYPSGIEWEKSGFGAFGGSENHRGIALWIGKDKNSIPEAEYYDDGDNSYLINKDDPQCICYDAGYKFEDVIIGTDKLKCTLTFKAELESPRPNTDQSFFYDDKGNVFTSDTLVTIPYVGALDTEGNPLVESRDFNVQICDQYGVYWYNTPTFNLANAEGSTTEVADEEGGFWWVDKGTSGKSVTVKISEQMQKSISLPATNTDGYIERYIVASCSENDGSATLSRKIRITYPKYDWNFDTTVIGSAYTADKIIMNDGSFYDANNDSQPDAHFKKADYLAYNQKASVYPVSAEREGFTFLGFWTQQQTSVVGQPGDPFSPESTFAYPLSDAEYDALSQEEKDANKYVKAGAKWDPKADSSQLNTEDDKTYHAWWLADDLNVKFYDIDGRYLLERTVKAGQGNGAFVWPTPTQQYVSGAFTYNNFKGIWEHTDGTEVDSGNHTFWKDLVLTPVYETVSFDNEYSIAFYNAYGAAMAGYTNKYTYRETARRPATNEMTVIPENAEYYYTFEGFVNWAPESGNYHIMLEDVDFDVNGHALNIIEDFTVRADASYYPVYRRHIKSYEVFFEYINEQAEYVQVYKTFNYGEEITPPDGVPAVYAEGGYEYKFLGWTKDNTDVNLSQEVCRPGAEYYAKYDSGTPTPCKITFVYKNEKGEDVTYEGQVDYGDYLSDKIIEAVKPYEKFDNGEEELYFNGIWEYNGKRYTTDALYSFSPEGHTTFTAVYEDGVPFYTVTYKDGDNTASYRRIKDSVLPQWTYEVETSEKDENGNPVIETKDYLPAIADTDEGRYTFLGWYDEEQLDIAATNGNKYEVGVTPITGNVTLYPQFSFGKFEYHIQFLNWDGTSLAKGTYNYLDSYEGIIRQAEAGAVRPADETYTYQFIGWDKKVPEFCEGGEPGSTITFVAQYKPVYIYYNIYWMNDAQATTPLKTSKYVYGDRISAPSVSLTPVGPDSSKHYVFAGWYYKDKDGNEVAYNRNITVTGNMQFYAKYVEATAVYTVTVVPGKKAENYSFTVEENTSLKDLVSNPVAGYLSPTKHDAFAGWYTTLTVDEATGETTYSNEFNIETDVVTGDITLYATYAEGDHVFNKSEVKDVPAYPMAGYTDYNGTVVPADDGKGVMTVWCECNKEKTHKDEAIDALTDNVKPTGTGYIGRKWNTADGDLADVVYASPKTSLILTTTDNGDKNEKYNPSALGIGVQEIHAAIYPASDRITEADIKFTDGAFDPEKGVWTKMYDWTQIQASLIQYYGGWDKIPSVYQNYPGNASAEVGLYNVTDGNTYKVYAVIVDKAGNWSFMETCSFVYDAKAPVVDFAGNSNTAKDKFCGEVTINVTEANAYTVKANGTELEADAEGVYKVSAPGYYNIVVEDIAGNKESKYVTVNADHDWQEYILEATCFVDGYKTQKCTVCGTEDEAYYEEIVSTGHNNVTKHVDATCTEDGYDEITCTKCGLKDTVYTDNTGMLLYPAAGHTYKQAEGSEEYEVIVTLPATCMAEGKGYNLCTVCGYRNSVTLPIDEDAHNPYPVKVIKSTCTQAGSRTQVCRYNPEHVLINETLPLAEHSFDAWRVETEAGCFEGVKDENGEYTELPAYGLEVNYCSKCGTENLDKDGNPVTRTVETLKNHFWQIVSRVENADGTKATVRYGCTGCTATRTETVDVEQLVTYKVEFIVGDAVTEIEVTRGESVAEDAVEEPTKANSADGKHKYTFRGWFTEGGEEYIPGNAVYSNLKLYPKFNESNIIYYVQFVKVKSFNEVEVKDDEGNVTGTKIEYTYEDPNLEDVTTLTGYKGAENRKPSSDPVLKGNEKYSFEFKGWKDTAGKFVTDFTVKDSATYYAVYEETKNEYNVIFMNGTEPFYVIEGLAAGDNAVYNKTDAEGNPVYPTKAPTAEKHYTFDGKWYTTADCKQEADLSNIQEKTVVYAGYNEAEHSFDEGTVIQKQDCDTEEITKFVCETCNYEKTETTKAAKGHTKDGGTYDAATGENIFACVDCGIELERTKASYTIKFFNDNGLAVGILTVPANAAVEFDYGEGNANVPTKKADAQYIYTFAGWKAPDGTEYKMGAELPKATADIVYTAYYTSTVRTYTVRFANVNNDVVYEVEGVAYGASVDTVDTEKKYAYTEAKYGGKKYNADGHYVFTGWDTDITKIVSDTLVRPEFTLEEHSFDGGKETGADCVTPGGTKYSCDCGYSYMGTETVPATGHKLVLNKDKSTAPDYATQTDGKEVYECVNPGCDYEKEVIISGKLAEIKVTVKDTAGNPIQNALVQLFNKADGSQKGADRTGSSGVVTFWVQPGEYTVTVKVDGVGDTSYDVSVDEDGNTTGNQDQVTINKPAEDEHKCECSCHRNNFWGGFFRFFQKIIKLFTGKASCCADPDSRI